jgi:hypothetical protein
MASFTINQGRVLREGVTERVTIDIANRGEASFKGDLQEVWEGVQADRADMLAQVRELQLALQLLIQAEGQRLATLVLDDRRLPALAMGLRLVGERITTLDEEISVAAVRVPMVKKTEALLNGRITDEARRSIGSVTVTLADANGAPIAGVPAVEADSGGYYAIVVPQAAAAAIDPQRKLQVLVTHDAESVAAVTMVSLQPGAVKVHDVTLNDAALDRLKLRLPTVAAVVPGREADAGPAKKGATPAKKPTAKRGPAT